MSDAKLRESEMQLRPGIAEEGIVSLLRDSGSSMRIAAIAYAGGQQCISTCVPYYDQGPSSRLLTHLRWSEETLGCG